jgi:hypothetical protein
VIKLKEILKEAGDVDIASVKQDLEKNLKRAGFRVKKFKQSKPGYNEVWSGAFYTNKAILPMSVDKYGSVFYDSTNIGKLNRGKKVIDYLKSIKSSNKWIESVNEDGHTDVASAKRKAMLMVEYSNKLLNKLNGMNKEDSLPSWLSDKITLASDYLHKATHYLLNPVESVNEVMSDAEIKKMHKKAKETGELPPHLKKILKGKKEFEKKFKVKDVVIPGLEWMSKLDEATSSKDFFSGNKVTNSLPRATLNLLNSKLNKVSETIIKITDKYKNQGDIEGLVKIWMRGLHLKLKKSGVKI